MSIDIDWETLTTGSDGLALAERIREFIHDKFQQVTLPRFIRSVQVHSFDFGTAAPEVELKDICDPLPDFYEEEEDGEDGSSEEGGHQEGEEWRNGKSLSERRQTERSTRTDSTFSTATANPRPPPYIDTRLPGLRLNLGLADHIASPLLSRSNTPGIAGGTSSLGYFHLPIGTGLSGSQTPLAAVAGSSSYSGALPDQFLPHSEGGHNDGNVHRRDDIAFADPSTRPSTAQSIAQSSLHFTARPTSSAEHVHTPEGSDSPPLTRYREKRPEDVQIVSRVRYSGDIKLSLTAEILLDYPMPSFVGIPLKLNITGMSFDGVAVIAYIRKRAHFCFLSPDDADALVGAEDGSHMEHDHAHGVGRRKVGGLLQEIKVESEIGQKESGKQVLKNVGKVEKFVLEQVRGIFEDEFVYPSFWTFLV
ncbi:MAG: Mitochondrial distribution and morphology protein 12 [Pleopsidium flavum]|nr:MAG: Mitochondrial distribution and morphology protein 12 [Pleopsidium flavum]